MFVRKVNGHNYSIEISDGERIITATSSFGGKPVWGTAKCSPEDTPNIEKGIELAILRCDAKIADKKLSRGNKKVSDAAKILEDAKREFAKANRYMRDAEAFFNNAMLNLESFESTL